MAAYGRIAQSLSRSELRGRKLRRKQDDELGGAEPVGRFRCADRDDRVLIRTGDPGALVRRGITYVLRRFRRDAYAAAIRLQDFIGPYILGVDRYGRGREKQIGNEAQAFFCMPACDNANRMRRVLGSRGAVSAMRLLAESQEIK